MTVDQLYESYNSLHQQATWRPCTHKRRRKLHQLMRKHRARAEAMMRADMTLPQYNFDYLKARFRVKFAASFDMFCAIKHGPPPEHTSSIVHPDTVKWILPIVYRRPAW